MHQQKHNKNQARELASIQQCAPASDSQDKSEVQQRALARMRSEFGTGSSRLKTAVNEGEFLLYGWQSERHDVGVLR